MRRVRVLTVDPGLHGTGWCLWPCLAHPEDTSFEMPSCWGVINASVPDWQEKARFIWIDFRDLVKKLNVQQIVIEMPELWTSGKSMAAGTSGDLHKLVYLIGGMGLIAEENGNVDNVQKPIMILPREWKGQMTKKAVIHRIKARIPKICNAIGNHEADAVGMGLSLQDAL